MQNGNFISLSHILSANEIQLLLTPQGACALASLLPPKLLAPSSSLFLKRYIYPLILLYTSYSGRTCDDVTIFYVKADLFEEGRTYFGVCSWATVSISLYNIILVSIHEPLIFWNILDKFCFIKKRRSYNDSKVAYRFL